MAHRRGRGADEDAGREGLDGARDALDAPEEEERGVLEREALVLLDVEQQARRLRRTRVESSHFSSLHSSLHSLEVRPE